MAPRFWLAVAVFAFGLYNIHYVRPGCTELCCGLPTNVPSFYFLNSIYLLGLSLPMAFMILFSFHNDPQEEASYHQLRQYMHEQRSLHGGG